MESETQRATRFALLIAMEIARIVDDLETRQVFLIDIWGRHRDRGPFLDTMASRWPSIGFPELALLPADSLPKLDEFYRELEEFRLYMQFTEDMPVALSDAYSWQLQRIQAYAEQAVTSLGGTPERPLLEFPDDPPSAESPAGRPLLELSHFEKPADLPEPDDFQKES